MPNMFQARVPDPTGRNTQGIWVSPMRDLAHCFPYLVRRTLVALESDVTDPAEIEMMSNYGTAIARFINACGDVTCPDVYTAMKTAGLTSMPKAAQEIFGRWLIKVMLGAYFDALRNALNPGEKALGVKELMETIRESEFYGKGSAPAAGHSNPEA